MSAGLDLALSPPPDPADRAKGWAILHRADCPQVRQLAADGVPVITMMGCQRMPPDDGRIVRHTCIGPPGDAPGRP